jgi:hypothetical protein
MRRFHAVLIVVMAWFSVVVVSGCTGSESMGSVTGKVIYKGDKVPKGCLVSFVSDKGHAALGIVDGNGEYKLIMAGKPTVPAALYSVSVTVPGIQGPEMTDDDERKFMAGDPETVAKFAQKKQKPSIPDKYSDASQSGLSFEVKPGTNTYNIQLE